MDEAAFWPFQTGLVAIHWPRRTEGIVDMSETRTKYRGADDGRYLLRRFHERTVCNENTEREADEKGRKWTKKMDGKSRQVRQWDKRDREKKCGGRGNERERVRNKWMTETVVYDREGERERKVGRRERGGVQHKAWANEIWQKYDREGGSGKGGEDEKSRDGLQW